MLYSCKEKEAETEAASTETMMSEYCENLSLIMSRNGRRSYHFVTPLLEGYGLAREPTANSARG